MPMAYSAAPQTVALDTCHKIYVERDYSLGLDVRFHRSFPVLLEGLIEPEDWYYTVDTINKLFELAESVSSFMKVKSFHF
jgi:hypothetical protein